MGECGNNKNKETILQNNSYSYVTNFSNINKQLPLLNYLDGLQWGLTSSRQFYTNQIRKALVKDYIPTFAPDKSVGVGVGRSTYMHTFDRRITSMVWHKNQPFLLAVASKFGDMIIVKQDNEHWSKRRFRKSVEINGSGAGCAIFAIKFHETDCSSLFRASLDGTVAKFDLVELKNSLVYHNTNSWTNWFTAMDVSTSTNTVLTGDNKGFVSLFTVQGEKVSSERLHSTKIHHCEFNNKLPFLIATSSLDAKDHVKLWDLRNLKKGEPLICLPHNKGVNVAHFNHLDGSRLLTSDQCDEIRIYQGPLWNLETTIKQGHRQFQHITPIKASWHPLNDTVVIGLYPKKEQQNLERSIQMYDASSGKLVHELYPPEKGLVSLNEFNSTGDVLASSLASKLLLWKPTYHEKESSNLSYSSHKPLSTQYQKNVLRGRINRGNANSSDNESEDDDDDPKQKLVQRRSNRSKPGATKRKNSGHGKITQPKSKRGKK